MVRKGYDIFALMTSFRLKSNLKPLMLQVCDGAKDCPEGEDEARALCSVTPCPGHLIRCEADHVCLPPTALCSGDNSEENKTSEKFDLTFSLSLLCINKILVAKLIDDSITRNSILYPNNKLWICLTVKCQIALTSLTQCTLPNI